jgi:hypothetical protein
MKTRMVAVFLVLVISSCHNSSGTTKGADSTTINTDTGNMPEGGPNHGLGDTNTYNRMNDTVAHDTTSKK